MSKGKIVVALGGNAILQPGQKGTFEEQLANVQTACEQVVQLVEAGYQVAIVHGNGPQVGNIIVQNDMAKESVPPMPLFVLGSESQGMIGYMIQSCVLKALKARGLDKKVATVVTQVEVDENDKAFSNPTKPVGMFFSEEEAKKAMAEKGEHWVEDAGRGWRKVVASPQPKSIVEKDVINLLVEQGVIVISAGGGGIPVVRTESGYRGVEAVIDKDLAAERLASELSADCLMILTDVSNVMLNYRQPDEKKLGQVSLDEMEKYMAEGHFKAGSMKPKVDACIRFVRSSGKKAIITSLAQAAEAAEGKAGTTVSC